MSVFTDAELLGCQTPRICCIPEGEDRELGDRAIDLLGEAGMELDEWEEFWLRASLVRRPDGKWAAMEVGGSVPRQNGKGSVLEARETTGLFLVESDRLITHSAHLFDTSLEHFRRIIELIEECPKLHKQIKPRGVSWSHGSEGIELRNGSRIRFRTRTKGGGRGFTGDLLVLDEAMYLSESALGALFSTGSARPNSQVWYTGSAVDQEVHPDGIVFARVRERGIEGDDPSLLYVEWSAEGDNPSDVPEDVIDNPQAWAAANPALGIRITPEFVAKERQALASRTFAVERLGVGDWPDTSGRNSQGIDFESWISLKDPASGIAGRVCFALDVAPDRSTATIASAGERNDGLGHVETVDRRRGTGWVVERMVQLVADHDPESVVVDGVGPAASFIRDLEDKGIDVKPASVQEHARAIGVLVDAVDQRTVRHLGTPELSTAVKGAVKRSVGDVSTWSRRSSSVDISPLVSVTLAYWAVTAAVPGEPVVEVFG